MNGWGDGIAKGIAFMFLLCFLVGGFCAVGTVKAGGCASHYRLVKVQP